MSVSIVSGPCAAELLQKVTSAKAKDRFALLTSTGSNQGRDHDPSRIAEQIRTIAVKGATDQLLIACEPEMPAMGYASLFLPHGNSFRPLSEVARLNTTGLAIKSSDLLDTLVRRRAVANLPSPCFIAEQLEFVDHIILEGANDGPDFQLAQTIATTLNPRVQISKLSEESIARLFHGEKSFDFDAALDNAGWRKLIDAENSYASRQLNLAAFAYRARRPFHPQRFWNFLQKELPGIFRAKGFFWLATRMDLVGGLNLAGAEMHLSAAGQWWAVRSEDARAVEMPERTRQQWKEPFGDRRQAIAFMGINVDPRAFKAHLDACLLTDPDMAARQENWQTLTDPFPSWNAHPHEHDCNHDHESGGHECCHH
jgi:G3E family GTPase